MEEKTPLRRDEYTWWEYWSYHISEIGGDVFIVVGIGLIAALVLLAIVIGSDLTLDIIR